MYKPSFCWASAATMAVAGGEGTGAATGAGTAGARGATGATEVEAAAGGCSGVRHSTHFRIRGAHCAQAHTSPQGRNITVAGASEQTTHSPIRCLDDTHERHTKHFFTWI